MLPSISALLLPIAVKAAAVKSPENSTFTNPILPGFHPDPSCIFVPEWDDTFFCATSSFQAFPGIPIHASKDLQNWKLVGNVLNRPGQLPDLANVDSATGYDKDTTPLRRRPSINRITKQRALGTDLAIRKWHLLGSYHTSV